MHRLFIALLAVFACSMATAQNTTVIWETLGNVDGTYTQRFTIKGDMSFDKIGFNMLPRKMETVNRADRLTTLMPGYYTLASKRFKQGADSVVVDIITKASYAACSYAPDGLHRIERDGSTRPVEYIRREVSSPAQWTLANGKDRMPYGDEIYHINSTLAGGHAGIYDVIPSYKNVTLTSGHSTLPLREGVRVIETDTPEYYTITVANDSVIVAAADIPSARRALDVFKQVVLADAPQSIPNVIIEDYPDYEYRGLMIDVSRNFQDMNTLRHIVDQMALYRMNRLHLHFVDDEGWRIEIPALPELTTYGSRRGYSTNERDYLFQQYSGDGNPASTTGVSNGYYTRDEFIDFLRYAADRGVMVIPEIEMPGHARAAVKAMEYRYRTTGDASYRMIDPKDKSSYTSAQAYHDNVMNPAVEGTYRFLDTVFDAVIDMYRQAGVPLLTIHIGGDEVAKGAWDGSPQAQRMIADKGLNGQTGLHGYFVERIAHMLNDKGVPMSGWQEIAVGHTPEYNAEMAPMTFSVNTWTNASLDPEKSVTAKALRAGFPVVISNVTNFYLDMCYNYHPEEPGLNWGGVVDEFQSLHGYPNAMYPAGDDQTGRVIGVSGQLFAETLRSPQMLELYLFPKMLGLVERAWNADTTYTDADYNAVIYNREMPRWRRSGINYHLRQPGIIADNGKIYMNTPYPGTEIRYTTDGSMPTADSPLYTGPIPAEGVSEVRARLYHDGHQSNVTYLILE